MGTFRQSDNQQSATGNRPWVFDRKQHLAGITGNFGEYCQQVLWRDRRLTGALDSAQCISLAIQVVSRLSPLVPTSLVYLRLPLALPL